MRSIRVAAVRNVVPILSVFLFIHCADQGLTEPEPSERPESTPVSTATTLARLTCRGSTGSGSVSCAPDARRAAAAGIAGGMDGTGRPVTIGGQGQFVYLESSNVSTVGGIFAFDVTVQNLIPQPLGTEDGVTPEPEGVRVFFAEEPHVTGGTGTIVIGNADGEATFTASDQPYFQYDGILQQNQTSGAVRWEMPYTGDVTFEFGVYVRAAVQFPDGYVDVTGAEMLVDGLTTQLTPLVRTFAGEPHADQSITWSTSDPAVATVSTSGLVTSVAPGPVTITATRGVITGSIEMDVCPSLDVGEVFVATFPIASRLCFHGGGAGDEFTYMPVNFHTAAVALSVTGSGVIAVTGPPTPGRTSVALGVRRTPAASHAQQHIATLQQQRERAEALNGKSAWVPITWHRTAGGITPGVPAVGALYTLGTGQCSGGTLRTGRVMAVGTRSIMVADTLNPSGGYSAADYADIADEFDAAIWPTITGNFGTPHDMDANARVVIFVTAALNEQTPPGASDAVYSSFSPLDLQSAAVCPQGNQGEIIYLAAVDPGGEINGNVVQETDLRRESRRALAHELQHLISASIRLEAGTDLEEVWLDEQLSAIAEELMFHQATGIGPDNDMGADTLATFPDETQTYLDANLDRLTEWLENPDNDGPFNSAATPAGIGAGWAFLRYAADRHAGSDAAFLSSLVSSTTTGLDNLAGVIGADPQDWARDFIAAMYADNVVATATEYSMPSWNFRSVYAGRGGFPLQTRPLTNGVSMTLPYAAGGATSYARFRVPATGFATITANSGGSIPATPFELAVMRTK